LNVKDLQTSLPPNWRSWFDAVTPIVDTSDICSIDFLWRLDKPELGNEAKTERDKRYDRA